MKIIKSSLLILDSVHAYLMTKKLKYFVELQATWLQKLSKKQNFVGLQQIFMLLEYYFLLFFVGSFLIEDKTIKNFIVRFQLGILSSLIMFQLVLDKL